MKPAQNIIHDFASELANAIRIAHHVPGRIRLKLINTLPLQKPEAPDMNTITGKLPGILKSIEEIPGVCAVRPNLLARSCVIEYDARLIPDRAWINLLSGENSPESEALLNVLAGKAYEIKNDLL